MNPGSGEQKVNGNAFVPDAQNNNHFGKQNGPLLMDVKPGTNMQTVQSQPQPRPQQLPMQNVPDAARASMDGVAPASAGVIPSRLKKHSKKQMKRRRGDVNSEILPKINESQTIEPEDGRKSKIPIILAVIGALAVITVVVLSVLLKGGNINWKSDYGDIDLEYISQTTIRLGVEGIGDVLEKVSYDGSCDRNERVKKPERDGDDVTWDLSEGAGKCTLRAKYQLRTIEKTFMVVSKEMERESLGLEDIYRTKINQESDEDKDGLANKVEKSLGTKIDLIDSDGDGLADGYEVNTSKTDPLNDDSDDDGLSDVSEIKLGYNPLKADTKGDGLKDGERKNSYKYQSGNVLLKLSGKGDIPNTTIDMTNGAALSKKTGLIPKLYSFYTAGKIDEATVTIGYTDYELVNAKIGENNLVLYRYDLSESKYEQIESKVNSSDKTVSAKIRDFSSYYVLGSKNNAYLDNKDSEIMFVLDNSWSMYTREQYKRITGKDNPNKSQQNDPDGRRFQLTKELVEKLDKKGVKVGIGEFSGDYVTVKKVGTKVEDLGNTLDGMNEHFHVKKDGTNISEAIRGGAKELSSKAGLKTVIVLTDGNDTFNFAQEVVSIANEMANKNVRVCVLGFGEGAYIKDVSALAEKTGCKYFSSSNVSGLDEVFNNLEILLNDELADIDDDEKMDGYVMADSGFMVARDGFSFRNYSSDLMVDGHCYGMATFAELYYSKKLPLRFDAITTAGLTSYRYNLSWSYFNNYQNLYEYKLRTEALKYVPQFGVDYFGEEEPAKKYVVKDGVINYSDSIRKEIDKTGLYDYYESKTKEKSDVQVQKYGFSYEAMEKARLSETKMQNSALIDDFDRSLINAIFANQIQQTTVKMYSSGSAIGVDGSITQTASKQMTNSNDFINLMTTRMQKHEAPVILAYFSGGLHAMNAINLVQDAKDSNHYYIGVYDSNYPGEKRYLELECSKYSCITKANSYYDESGEVVRMSLSLEEDLKPFKTNEESTIGY